MHATPATVYHTFLSCHYKLSMPTLLLQLFCHFCLYQEWEDSYSNQTTVGMQLCTVVLLRDHTIRSRPVVSLIFLLNRHSGLAWYANPVRDSTSISAFSYVTLLLHHCIPALQIVQRFLCKSLRVFASLNTAAPMNMSSQSTLRC